MLNVGKPYEFSLNSYCFVRYAMSGSISSLVFLFFIFLPELLPGDYRFDFRRGEPEVSTLIPRFNLIAGLRYLGSGDYCTLSAVPIKSTSSSSAASTFTVGSFYMSRDLAVVLARTFFFGLGFIMSPKFIPAMTPFLRKFLTARKAS